MKLKARFSGLIDVTLYSRQQVEGAIGYYSNWKETQAPILESRQEI